MFFDQLGQLSQPDNTFSNMSRGMGYSPNGNSALGRFNQDQGFDSKRGEVMGANDIAQSIAKAVAAYYSGGASLKMGAQTPQQFGAAGGLSQRGGYAGMTGLDQGGPLSKMYNAGMSPQMQHMNAAYAKYIPPHYGAFGDEFLKKSLSFVPKKPQPEAYSAGGSNRNLLMGDPSQSGNSDSYNPIY